MKDIGLKNYIEKLRARGQVLPPNPEAVRVYNESMAKLLPKIEADLKASARAAHFCRLGIPDPRKAIAAAARKGRDAKQARGASPAERREAHRPTPNSISQRDHDQAD